VNETNKPALFAAAKDITNVDKHITIDGKIGRVRCPAPRRTSRLSDYDRYQLCDNTAFIIKSEFTFICAKCKYQFLVPLFMNHKIDFVIPIHI
jgi:hypothetical protein